MSDRANTKKPTLADAIDQDEKPVLPVSDCPWCGHKLDTATHLDDETLKPSPGDLSMCLSCLSVLRFRHDLQLEALPDAELRELPDDVRNYLHQMRAAASIDRTEQTT